MNADLVTLYHPVLDRSTRVPARSVPGWERRGWVQPADLSVADPGDDVDEAATAATEPPPAADEPISWEETPS